MIYHQVEVLAAEELKPYRARLEQIAVDLTRISDAIREEDSKRREGEMRVEIENLRKSERSIWGIMETIRESTFKVLLAEEYGLPLGKKFDKVYAVAYDHGHSSGHHDVEAMFSQLISIVQDEEESKFFNFIADRLVNVYKENPDTDFVLRLRGMAKGL